MNFKNNNPIWMSLPVRPEWDQMLLLAEDGCSVKVPTVLLLGASPLVRNILVAFHPALHSPLAVSVGSASFESLLCLREILLKKGNAFVKDESMLEKVSAVFTMLGVQSELSIHKIIEQPVMICASLLEDGNALPGEENDETGIAHGDNEQSISNSYEGMKNENFSYSASFDSVTSVLDELENILEKNQLVGTDNVEEKGNINWQYGSENPEVLGEVSSSVGESNYTPFTAEEFSVGAVHVPEPVRLVETRGVRAKFRDTQDKVDKSILVRPVRAKNHDTQDIGHTSILDNKKHIHSKNQSSINKRYIRNEGPNVAHDIVTKKRAKRCNRCAACKRKNCGVCWRCKDMPAYGGKGKLKKVCIKRICHHLYAAPNVKSNYKFH